MQGASAEQESPGSKEMNDLRNNQSVIMLINVVNKGLFLEQSGMSHAQSATHFRSRSSEFSTRRPQANVEGSSSEGSEHEIQIDIAS